MVARIYKPSRNAMQSGVAKTKHWVLEFEPEHARMVEPLMGYTSSADMRSQIRLTFDSKEEAVAYAQKRAIPFQLFEPHEAGRRKIAYSDNFSFNRAGQWTH
ncbi:ETC complex I subunit [Xanthobacter sp. AM11]|uniref:ETC complex I subunit n=1 Tax=Xanthobacter sp. AM11 TaxID=3380643 RepID=UPI0039BEF722